MSSSFSHSRSHYAKSNYTTRLDFGPSLLRLGLFLVLLTVLPAVLPLRASAQTYPNFPQPATGSTAASPLRGASIVSFHSDLYGDILYAFYADYRGPMAYAVSTDGTNFFASTIPGNGAGGYYLVAQNAAYPQQSGVGAVRLDNNHIILGYVDYNTYQLVLLEATFVSGVSYGLTFQEIYRDPNPGIVSTAPGLMLDPNSGNVIAIYGTANRSSQTNEAWTTYGNPSTGFQSSDANFISATQPGLASFNGQNYVATGGGVVNVSNLDGTGHLIGGSTHSTQGTTDSGLAMTVWQNQLIFIARNSGNHALDAYVQVDGINYGINEYSGLLMGAAPGLTVYNGGLSAVFKANDSSYVLFATHSVP